MITINSRSRLGYVAMLTMMAVAFSMMITNTAFAGAKPPNAICGTIDGMDMALVLGIKKSPIKIKTADGNVKFYDVKGVLMETTGDLRRNVVTGSGYLGHEDKERVDFYVDLHSTHVNEKTYNMMIFWSVVGDGFRYLQIDHGDSTAQIYTDITEQGCDTFDIVFSD